MTKLVIGMTLKINCVDLEKIIASDWINKRKPRKGDIALVERLSDQDGKKVIRLCCEPRPGSLEWRVDIYELGVKYEMLSGG